MLSNQAKLPVSISASALENAAQKPAGLPAEDSDAQQPAAVALPPSEAKERTATLGERTFNCCYPGKGGSRWKEPIPASSRCRETLHLYYPPRSLTGLKHVLLRGGEVGCCEPCTDRAPRETVTEFSAALQTLGGLIREAPQRCSEWITIAAWRGSQ